MSLEINDPQKILDLLFSYQKELKITGKHYSSMFISFIDENSDFSEILSNWFDCNNKIEIVDHSLISLFSKIKYLFNKNQFQKIESFENYRIENVEEYYLKNNVKKTTEKDHEEFCRPDRDTKHRIISIDCEMIQTILGTELGRVTVVDENREVIYDTTVLPDYPIVDYCTAYSGLTKDCFIDAIEKTTLYIDLKRIIGKNTFIVGASLSTDLLFLKFYHDKLIDIQHLYTENSKKSLKFLAKKYLGRNIQIREHCSAEDAQVSLELLYYYHNIRDEATLKDVLFILNTQMQNKYIKIKPKYLFLIKKEDIEELKEIGRKDIFYVFFYRYEEKRVFALY
ncbi:RNA exonuclease 1 [Spraguea lophii 42_110]|uniref:RNA exonuclease 1 n=1 Tax=Spraguea lophii (strain 42_110) TaxID=1358809 RepID=S7WAE3_SPRLO|nr:RNA exonuclease 1 [Spraguea lophii 42_110]